MRTWLAWSVAGLAVAAAGWTALSLSRGQERSTPTPPAVPSPPSNLPPTSSSGAHLELLVPFPRQVSLSARGGADWLHRANGPDGRFVYGFVPSLNTVLEGDHYLRQIGAAFALARAARLTGDERYTAKARQAVVTLLLDTMPDPHDPEVRTTSLPSVLLNRLATAGLLVMAINELPAPAEDLLKQSEQLCAYIRKQQQPDGALSCRDAADPADAVVDPDAVNYYPGAALYGLMLSQRHKPAAWKTEVVARARGFYQPWWRAHKNPAPIPWHAAAYAEAYLLTHDKAFADAVTEMADWLCTLQYVQLDRNHPHWLGGFRGWRDGKPAAAAPDCESACAGEALAAAFRVARQAGDQARCQRYREALEHCLRFVTTLQYTESNSQHFADWYRPVLLGAFHASHQDGSLRLDYTQHAVCALFQYLADVAEGSG